MHVLEPDGAIATLAVAHSDPAKLVFAQELQDRYPPDPANERGAAAVIRSGDAKLVPEIPEDAFANAARDEMHEQLLRQLGVRSFLCVPISARGQTLGAIVQGLGGVFLEHLVYSDEGQLLTGSLADYLLPTAKDFPNVRVIALENYPSPHNPLGAKGAGEGGIIPVGGVIANAVAAALRSLGVQLRELPLSPPRLWQLIQHKASA